MEQVSSLKTDIRYKDTPIGKIPVDWQVVPLSKVSQIKMGQSPPPEECNNNGDGLPFYQANTEIGLKDLTPKKWCNRLKIVADEGDILVSVRAPVGEICISPHKCCIGRGIAALKPKSVHAKFLYQAMLLHGKPLFKMAQGSRFENINSKGLSDLLLSLPPLFEQKKIAEILSMIDNAIDRASEIIEKEKELQKGLMQSMKKRQKKIVELMDLMYDLIAIESDHEKCLERLKKGLSEVLLTGKIRVGV